jgi:hypothetical protein
MLLKELKTNKAFAEPKYRKQHPVSYQLLDFYFIFVERAQPDPV